MTKIKKLTSTFRKFNDRFWSNRLVTRCFLTAGTLMLAVGEMRAQTTGSQGFTNAEQTIRGYAVPVGNLMKAIAAVIALVGAFNVYFKMQNGDQDVKKTIMLTIGGCVAFIAMSQALPLFFN